MDASKNERVVKAFEQLKLPFDAMELSSIDGAYEPNDIFVIFEKDDFNDTKACVLWSAVCAIAAEYDYFLSVGDGVLKYPTDAISLCNPLYFLSAGGI